VQSWPEVQDLIISKISSQNLIIRMYLSVLLPMGM